MKIRPTARRKIHHDEKFQIFSVRNVTVTSEAMTERINHLFDLKMNDIIAISVHVPIRITALITASSRFISRVQNI